MRSLILKDLYNIGHNAKSMLFVLVVFAVVLIPASGVESYTFVCAILCSMMIVTTFTFDDNSKWTRYSMIIREIYSRDRIWKICCFGNLLPDWKSIRAGSISNRWIGFEKDYF